MAIVDVGSRIKAPTTLIGEKEGDHNDDRETLNTALRKQSVSQIDREMTKPQSECHTMLNEKVA